MLLATMAVNSRTSRVKERSDAASPFDTFDSELDGGNENAGFNKDNYKPKNEQDDGFDPFQIGATVKKGKSRRLFGRDNKATSASPSSESKGTAALAPRLDVKFQVHEEVSSGPSSSNLNEGACDVFIVGTVCAQVTSSDALKNAPFVLAANSPMGTEIEFSPNETYAKIYSTKGQQGKINVIKIPKSSLGFVEIGTYRLSETIDHMPLLLEKKITKADNRVQMAFQVRSKLTNLDDLHDFSVAVSMDESVIGDSVAITSGNGEWDKSKRVIIWKLSTLPKGESFMVTARARLNPEGETLRSEDLQFPVMLRCKSQDQISTAHFHAIEASGFPATISFSNSSQSFRLIHRLN